MQFVIQLLWYDCPVEVYVALFTSSEHQSFFDPDRDSN